MSSVMVVPALLKLPPPCQCMTVSVKRDGQWVDGEVVVVRGDRIGVSNVCAHAVTVDDPPGLIDAASITWLSVTDWNPSNVVVWRDAGRKRAWYVEER